MEKRSPLKLPPLAVARLPRRTPRLRSSSFWHASRHMRHDVARQHSSPLKLLFCSRKAPLTNSSHEKLKLPACLPSSAARGTGSALFPLGLRSLQTPGSSHGPKQCVYMAISFFTKFPEPRALAADVNYGPLQEHVFDSV